MYNRFALGIDGGASKVLTQLFTINKNNEIIDQSEPFEQSYKDVDTFNHQFIPVPLNTQNEEMNNENYKIGFNEKGQSKVIIKAIIESIKYFNYKKMPIFIEKPISYSYKSFKNLDYLRYLEKFINPRVPLEPAAILIMP